MNEVTFHTDIVPTLATAHVTEETANELDKGDVACAWTIVAPYEHGWFIYVQPNGSHAELKVPDDLRKVMEWANERGLKWLRLDSAGNQLDEAELPSYDW